MSDAPRPTPKPAHHQPANADEPASTERMLFGEVRQRPTTHAELIESLQRQGFLTRDDPPRTIIRPLGSDDRYLTPKTSRA